MSRKVNAQLLNICNCVAQPQWLMSNERNPKRITSRQVSLNCLSTKTLRKPFMNSSDAQVLQLLRLSQRLWKASLDHLLAAYIKCSHRFMFSSLKWFTAAPQSLTDSLQPAAVFASNSRFMTQGDNMHQAILSVSRAAIMYISSLSQTFHLSCFHLLMHHVGMVCLSGREATYCTHTPAVPAITCLKLILI